MLQLANTETINEFAMSLPGVTQSFPFDESTLVFKVGGKMFALLDVDEFEGVNLKCNPKRAVELRDQYDGINPGYHMNKVHWNTVIPDPLADVETKLFWELLLHSYDLVLGSLTKKVQAEIPPGSEF